MIQKPCKSKKRKFPGIAKKKNIIRDSSSDVNIGEFSILICIDISLENIDIYLYFSKFGKWENRRMDTPAGALRAGFTKLKLILD